MREFTSLKSMLKASVNYPKGYPVPLCVVMMIILLVLNDLVTLPDLPPLKEDKKNIYIYIIYVHVYIAHKAEPSPRRILHDMGFFTNVKTVRDFPQVSGRNVLLIFLSKIERIVLHLVAY